MLGGIVQEAVAYRALFLVHGEVLVERAVGIGALVAVGAGDRAELEPKDGWMDGWMTFKGSMMMSSAAVLSHFHANTCSLRSFRLRR